MSMVEALGRVQSIEAWLEQLAQGTRVSAAPSSSSGAAADAASFATALNTALGASSSSVAFPSLSALMPSAGSTTAAAGAVPTAGAATAGAAAGAATAGISGGSVSGDAVVAAAKKYIGVPYIWGGTNPAVGMDCSGFVQRVFKDLGVELPRVVSDQMQKGTPVASLADAKPGDLLVSYGGEHISIYLGNGKAIDAPVPGQTIQIRDAWEKYSNLTSIRRIVPAGGA